MRSRRALDPDLYLPQTSDDNRYGRLITLGYHITSGPLHDPLKDRSERNKEFLLRKQVNANGLKIKVDASGMPEVSGKLDRSTSQNRNTIRVAVPNRPDQVIEWTVFHSPNHDIYQFGRDESNNDFYIPGHSTQPEGDRCVPPKLLSLFG